MKNLFLLFLFFLSIFSHAQSSYIVDKKGVKIFVRDDATEVILIDKRVSYVLLDKTWPKYIKFDDLDHANINGIVLKSFKLNGSKKSAVYFVLSESNDKTLIARSITTSSNSTSGNMTYSNVSCAMYVIDKEQKMIEDVVFRIIYEKEAEQAVLISQLIRKYFSECEELINYLENREADETILNICNNTKFINCK
jgi:hypothetical protein